MKRTTSLFWDCECERNFWRRAHEEKCEHCGAERENQPDSSIAELLQYHSEFLATDEITALERAVMPVLNEIWILVVSDGTIDIREVKRSMLDAEEAYVRRAEELGAPWDEKALDYDWSHMEENCAVFGIDTTIAELI